VRLGVDVLPTMNQAVIHNGIVYLSGQIDGAADDIKGQTKNILKKVDQYLQEAGTDKSKLLTSTMVEGYRERFRINERSMERVDRSK